MSVWVLLFSHLVNCSFLLFLSFIFHSFTSIAPLNRSRKSIRLILFPPLLQCIRPPSWIDRLMILIYSKNQANISNTSGDCCSSIVGKCQSLSINTFAYFFSPSVSFSSSIFFKRQKTQLFKADMQRTASIFYTFSPQITNNFLGIFSSTSIFRFWSNLSSFCWQLFSL